MIKRSKTFWKIFNTRVPIRSLLQELGFCDATSNSIYCPFHPDERTGHKSATIRDQGNILFCFSERRQYRPYDVLKLLNKQPEEYSQYYLNGDPLPQYDDPVVSISDRDRILVLEGKLSVGKLYKSILSQLISQENENQNTLRQAICKEFELHGRQKDTIQPLLSSSKEPR